MKSKSLPITVGIFPITHSSKDYINSVKASLELLQLLFPVMPSLYDDIANLLIKLCQSHDDSSDSVMITCFLRVLTDVIEKSAASNINLTLLQTPKEDNISNWAEFAGQGILSTNSSVIINAWVKFINESQPKIEWLKIDATSYLTTCMCDKIDSLFEINKLYLSNDDSSQIQLSNVDDSICELIIGLQSWLNGNHMVVQASLDQVALFGNNKGGANGANKDASGFFGSVIQGVFQVESPEEKNELLLQKEVILRSLKKAVLTCFKIWLWCDENTKFKSMLNGRTSRMGSLGTLNAPSIAPEIPTTESPKSPHFLKFSKSTNYNASKMRFRSKKILEGLFSLEPLETLETLIGCQQTLGENHYAVFKIIHVLDGSRSQKTLPHLINSLVSRVNITSLEPEKRSSLITDLTERQVSIFLVNYVDSLSSDTIEDIWPQVTQFLKELYFNYTSFKYVYPDMLKFAAIVGIKLSQTSFGDQKKVKKDMSESFSRILNIAVTMKVSADESSLTSMLNPMNMLQTDSENDTSSVNQQAQTAVTQLQEREASVASSIREGSPGREIQDKHVIKDDLASALVIIIPKIPAILVETDKISTALNSIIYNTCAPFTKSRVFISAPSYMLDLFVAIASLPQSSGLKVWKGLMSDIFSDPRFFSLDGNDKRWVKIFQSWIKDDSEKLGDLITKMLPYNGSGPTLFAWNDTEANTKILNIKKITYLILICENDYFLTHVQELQVKINDVVDNSSNPALKPYILALYRALILKFSEPHLISSWPTIYTELQSIFQYIYNVLADHHIEEDPSAPSDDNDNLLKRISIE
ncbi:unnamed protein product [Ambrosiozyma monospora]|uniref:Unnamed protein product n=1 Tax=Ambrosiozyma monospora TaxID=43982 RepID=A0ACB5SZ62_AMBMO|nr:unnamed protein product [Ambrosiozyma monospora]